MPHLLSYRALLNNPAPIATSAFGLRAANVFEIGESSLQVLAVLYLSNKDSLTLLTRFFEGHPRLGAARYNSQTPKSSTSREIKR
jgi:hypothetical protein